MIYKNNKNELKFEETAYITCSLKNKAVQLNKVVKT